MAKALTMTANVIIVVDAIMMNVIIATQVGEGRRGLRYDPRDYKLFLIAIFLTQNFCFFRLKSVQISIISPPMYFVMFSMRTNVISCDTMNKRYQYP